MSQISLNLNFSGAILPVIECHDGYQRVPLKPISDLFGLDWKSQKRKISASAWGQESPENEDEGGASPPLDRTYLPNLLGISTEDVFYADRIRQMICLRLDRVAGFLFTINPGMVRAFGNEGGAAFLEQKHQEWLDLIHAYECQRGDMFGGASLKKVYAIAKIDRMRDPALKKLALAEIGVSIPEAVAANPTGDLFAA